MNSFLRRLFEEIESDGGEDFVNALRVPIAGDRIPILGTIKETNQFREDNGLFRTNYETEYTFSFRDKEGKIHLPQDSISNENAANDIKRQIGEGFASRTTRLSNEVNHGEKRKSYFSCDLVAARAELFTPFRRDVNVIVDCRRFSIGFSGEKNLVQAKRVTLFDQTSTNMTFKADFNTLDLLFLGQCHGVRIYIAESGLRVYDIEGIAFSNWLENKLEEYPSKDFIIDTLKLLSSDEKADKQNELIARGIKSLQGSPWIKASELFPADKYLNGNREILHRASFINVEICKDELRLAPHVIDLLNPLYIAIQRPANSSD